MRCDYREESVVRIQAKMEDGTNCRKGGAHVLAYFLDDVGRKIEDAQLKVTTLDKSDGTYLITFEVNKVRTSNLS